MSDHGARHAAHRHAPMAAGTLLATLAALSFGVTTPIVARFGHGVGSLTTAALLYCGAALAAVAVGLVVDPAGAPLRRTHLPRLLAVALVGAGLAPTLLAWGLQRAGGTTGSLLLNLEAVFTALLAAALYREPLGRRVALALALMACGGALLTFDAASGSTFSLLGALAIASATFAWALDNTLTRPLAELDPERVVAAKGSLGALCTGMIAFGLEEPRPAPKAVAVLLACGATGYGLSLRLYLLAQRRIGAARTGSVFALAPFVGAALAWALGEATPSTLSQVSAALFALGVAVHVSEDHGHPHLHAAIEHEHAHRHDDGHHDHRHDPPVEGEHTHAHRHEAIAHDHPHGPDIHHDHAHEGDGG
jgi:drug/metabolite transporter (DMT)-like permease